MPDKSTLPKKADGTFDCTIIRANNLNRKGRHFSRFFVVVEIGEQIHKTRVSARGRQPVWNETFTVTAQSSQDVTISLYQRRMFRKEILVGRITGRLMDLGLKNKDVTRGFSAGSPTSITFRVGEISFNRPNIRMFALIIGIDEYTSPTIDDLDGCVNDAKSIKTFLTERFHVPDSQILFLVNESATRDGIISGLQTHLIQNNKVENGDAIIIFFAGHGSCVEVPQGWSSTDNKVETICPHDERTEDSQGRLIHGIPDRTINCLLRDLARSKGNNITVIFDCCHSVNIGRNSSHRSTKARFVTTSNPIPKDLDSTLPIQACDTQSIHAGFQSQATSSHIFLAACRNNEVAYESVSIEGLPCGAFTNSLVQQLHRLAIDRVTYSDLIDFLPELINQHPHCQGMNKNRLLFNGKSICGDLQVFRLAEWKEGRIRVDAGSIHGVVVGTEFAVHDQDEQSTIQGRLGILVAVVVTVNSTTLARRPGDDEFTVPDGARVLVLDLDAFTLNVFVDSDSEEQISACLNRKLDTQANGATAIMKRKFVQVNSRAKADVAIGQEPGGALRIERLDTLIPNYASRMVHVTMENNIYHLPLILDAVTHFNYHLVRHHGSDPLEQKISMELFRLTQTMGGWFRLPDEKLGNLFFDNEARIVLDDDAEYGIALVNHSEYDLFPYIFYFDPSNYSIQSWYVPPTSPPLGRSQGSNPTRFTIGYGTSGSDVFEFTLKEGEQSDTGFIKLFVSTKYIDMDWITQGPPPDSGRSSCGGDEMRQNIGIWGALTAAVTVHTGGEPALSCTE